MERQRATPKPDRRSSTPSHYGVNEEQERASASSDEKAGRDALPDLSAWEGEGIGWLVLILVLMFFLSFLWSLLSGDGDSSFSPPPPIDSRPTDARIQGEQDSFGTSDALLHCSTSREDVFEYLVNRENGGTDKQDEDDLHERIAEECGLPSLSGQGEHLIVSGSYCACLAEVLADENVQREKRD